MPNATTTYPVMTMAEMERAFDQEWVLILEPRVDDESGDIVAGIVAAHSASRDDVEREAMRLLPEESGVLFLGVAPGSVDHLL